MRDYIIEDKKCRTCHEVLPRTKSPFGWLYHLICPKCGTNN